MCDILCKFMLLAFRLCGSFKAAQEYGNSLQVNNDSVCRAASDKTSGSTKFATNFNQRK